MIKKSLVTAVLILGIYHFLYPHLSHRFFKVNGQQRGNYLRAQTYMYDVAPQTNVMIGSSMSLALNDELLGPRFFKLTLPGNSIFTALEIIRRAGKIPPVLLIEANSVEAKADEEFIGELFTPWLDALRRSSRIFREEGRPTNFLVAIVDSVIAKAERLVSFGRSRPTATQLQADVMTQVLDIYAQAYQRAVSPQLLQDHAQRLGEEVDALTRQGTICVLYEMPIDKSLVDQPLPTANREAVRARFPKEKYHWLTFSHDHNYETVDGIHLTDREAHRLTESIVEQLDRIKHASTGGVPAAGATSP